MHTSTNPGGGIGGTGFSCNYDANVYSLNVVCVPAERLYTSTTFGLQDTRTTVPETVHAGLDGYDGDVYTFFTSAEYAYTEATKVNASLSYARSRNDQTNYGGLPMGVAYESEGVALGVTHQFQDNLSGGLQYSFYRYRDDHFDDEGDYTAHGIFGSVTMTF